MSFELVSEMPQEDWSRLAHAAGNPFLTPEWAECWREELMPDARPVFLVGRHADGRAWCVWPLVRERRGGLTIARQFGYGPADEGGPACRPEDRPAAADGLRRALADGELGADAALLERLPDDPELAERLGGRLVVREPAPVLPAHGRSWEDFLASRSRNFRDQVRRMPRRLERRADVAWRRARDGAEVRRGLDALFDLHARRWESDGAFAPPFDAFHRAWATRASERGWLRLWTLEADGDPVAAWYGFRFAGADSYYQSGRDPEWDRFGVGGILFARTVQDAFADGVREYRLLRGGEEYKSRWAEEDHSVDTRLIGRGPVVRGAVRVAGRLAARPRPRRLMSRLAA